MENILPGLMGYFCWTKIRGARLVAAAVYYEEYDRARVSKLDSFPSVLTIRMMNFQNGQGLNSLLGKRLSSMVALKASIFLCCSCELVYSTCI